MSSITRFNPFENAFKPLLSSLFVSVRSLAIHGRSHSLNSAGAPAFLCSELFPTCRRKSLCGRGKHRHDCTGGDTFLRTRCPSSKVAGISDSLIESDIVRNSEIRSKSVASKSRLNVGFLTYDLQRNTEDALFEVAQAASFSVKAFPLYAHSDQEHSRVAYRPAMARGKHLGVNVKGSTPEGFVSNPEWRVGLACARESDVVILKGLLGLGAIGC